MLCFEQSLSEAPTLRFSFVAASILSPMALSMLRRDWKARCRISSLWMPAIVPETVSTSGARCSSLNTLLIIVFAWPKSSSSAWSV